MRWPALLFAMSLSIVPVLAVAQQAPWPNGPIRIIVPYPAASAGDAGIRKIGPLLQAELGVPIVVENRPGANGNIGTEAVAIAAPDGQTLVLATDIQFAILPALGTPIPYDPDKSFVTVGAFMAADMILAADPRLKVGTLQELVALAKSKPDEFAYGSVGMGSHHHLFMEYLKSKGGFTLLHVPYRGSGAALPDLISGKIHLMAMGIPQSLPHFKEGKLVPLAVGTSQRYRDLPNVPTISESGFPGFEARVLWGVWAPAGTPEPILAKFRAAMSKAVQDKDVVEWFTASGFSALTDSPADFDKRMRTDRQKWAELVKTANINLKE